MTLEIVCKSCRQVTQFNERVTDRVQLANKKGETIDIKCKNCGHIEKYHVDEITAENNRLMTILSSVVLLIGISIMVYFIWNYIGRLTYIYSIAGLLSAGLIPILIYSTIIKAQRNKRDTFNKHKLKGVLGTINFRKE